MGAVGLNTMNNEQNIHETKMIWVDGSESTRAFQSHIGSTSSLYEIIYLTKDGNVHRPDGGPARFLFYKETKMLDSAWWCVNGKWSMERFTANKPSSYVQDSNMFEWIDPADNHNQCRCGPCILFSDGETVYSILGDGRISLDEFKEHYICTHLEEYVPLTQEQNVKLYTDLYHEMMVWFEKELEELAEFIT